MKVTALVVVLGLMVGALASKPEAVLTVFGNFTEAKWAQARLPWAQIGTEELTTNFIPFIIDGETIQVGLGIKLSASGDNGKLQFRFHSKQEQGKEYDFTIQGNYVLITPEGQEYLAYPYSTTLYTQDPATEWDSILTKKVIESQPLKDGNLLVNIQFESCLRCPSDCQVKMT